MRETPEECTCGMAADEGSLYCGSCGKALGSEAPGWLPKSCVACGRAYPSAAKFCDVCGSPLQNTPPRPPTLILADPGGRSIRMEGPHREFGRADFVDWLRHDEGRLISRAHFRISAEGSEFILEHVSTANPTVLNGSTVARRRRLARGDVIDLADGALRLLVRIE